MIKLNIRFFFIIILLFIAFLQRAWVGFNIPTGDLMFYANDSVTQFTRLGFEKNLLFYPLLLINTVEGRIIALSFVMSALLITAVNFSYDKRDTTLTALLVLMSLYLAQIDMHLVRQQIAIYLYFIAFCINSRFLRYLFFGLSLLYHEVVVLLIFSNYLSYLFSNYCWSNFGWNFSNLDNNS